MMKNIIKKHLESELHNKNVRKNKTYPKLEEVLNNQIISKEIKSKVFSIDKDFLKLYKIKELGNLKNGTGIKVQKTLDCKYRPTY